MFEQIDFQNYESIFSRSNYPIIDETNLAIDMSGPCLCLSGKSFKDCCNIDIQIGLKFKETHPKQSNIILKEFYEINKFYQNLSKAPKTKSVDIENESRFYNHKIKYCSLFEIDGNNCDN
ncbi:SEC-C metal-binding domain-containing protein, partial [Streptococcus oralis]|uniref:SEC-C metal-binding domain-containing protein n=3 Tax=Streptococcus oralis TaxID=1303 RepID=UPI001C8C1346